MNKSNCGGCGAEPSSRHFDNCDVARCVGCGEQAWCCGCPEYNPDVWTGFWPGEVEAADMGFWCYWGPDYGERGWVVCDPNHPSARPDLNTYYEKTVWDAEKQERVLRA